MLVQDELADRGERPDSTDEYARDLLLALEEDVWPRSIMTDGARTILQRRTGSRDRQWLFGVSYGGRRGR